MVIRLSCADLRKPVIRNIIGAIRYNKSFIP